MVSTHNLQEEIYKVSRNCFVCGSSDVTYHHVPPKGMRPRIMFKIPLCKVHHDIINGNEFTGRQTKCLTTNLRHIRKALKNIEQKVLIQHITQPK